eukprot:CAMPEP_0202712926 /NCGR_PEP_ID=MMETSP1385-20130828/47571_1 /ASSEMBLY_ACC=CAM_ASM_000861 /TAXON_ID=933848 /ORGANISM="Elphidium margaritaceum" /LENGTH=348 /DNA_ID=CAMNT_0049373119 /DNA_START=21 /DNA_END=1064 /DNA_ORIENTATION=+
MTHKPDLIECGSYTLKWGESITDMEDSTLHAQHNDVDTLRHKLCNDGYLLLRNQIPTKLIDAALQVVASGLQSTWKCVDTDECKTIRDLHIADCSTGVLLTGYKPITHHKQMQSLLHCQPLLSLMYKLFDAEPVTHDTKWVRVKATGEYTDEHADIYRFADNARSMLTVWMPLMDVPICKGPLAVCPQSHLLNFAAATAAASAAERHNYYDIGNGDRENMEEIEVPAGFEEFNRSAVWTTTDFRKGDIIIFDIRLVHASLVNRTRQFRVSVDTRWQPKECIPYWNSLYVRFPQFMAITHSKELEQKAELDDLKNSEHAYAYEKTSGDEDNFTTFTDSDNDVVDQLDFE